MFIYYLHIVHSNTVCWNAMVFMKKSLKYKNVFCFQVEPEMKENLMDRIQSVSDLLASWEE